MEEQKKWAGMSHQERWEYLEQSMDKKLMFSVKLLLVYIQNLKQMENNKTLNTVDLVEEGFKDRMLILAKDIKSILLFITQE